MASGSAKPKRPAGDDRVFVRNGLHSFRKTYKLGEVYYGLGTAGVLAGLVGWVGWKGANPDPDLFDVSASLLEGAGPSPDPPASAPDRGPLPEGLTELGLTEGKVGAFTADNLYVKINGRAGFFKAFGVRSLHAVTLELPSEPGSSGPAASIDIELYDLAAAQNALGAYNGERAPSIQPTLEAGGAHHYDRNAAFVARGPYYARLIGSEESEPMSEKLRALVGHFRQQIAGAELPWAFSLFVDQLGLSAGQVSYLRSNAFSFGFASDVYKVALSAADSSEDLEAFVVAQASPAEAIALAQQFQQGFESLGSPAGETAAGVPLQKADFLESFSGSLAVERWVVGVRGAASPEQAHSWLERLRSGMRALPVEVKKRAVSGAATGEPGDE